MRDDESLRGDARFERRNVERSLIQVWQERTHSVEMIAGASEDMFSVRPDFTIDTIPSAAITANFFPMLGVQPMLGRGFRSEEEQPEGQAAVAMISYALWQRTYGGRAGVGGSGSLKPGPAIFALLRPGVSAEAASRELRTIDASLSDSVQVDTRLRVMRAQDFLDARETRAVQVLFAAVGALLLIACANVANLLLARAWARQREFAVRAALGAGRRRLARQVLTESISLALVGGMLGVGVAWLALHLIVALRPPALDHLAGVRIEPPVLLWSLGVSVATGILFGCAPAFFAGARPVGDVLRRETRSGSAGVASRRVRSALIVLEIATSLVLLVASGLLVRSFAALQRMPLGLEPRGLVSTDVLIGPRNRNRAPAVRAAILQRLRTLPGVTGAAIGTMPGKGFLGMGGVDAESDRARHTTHVPVLGSVIITPDYFRVARIALLVGRLPDSSAWVGSPLGLSSEVLVNREFARRVWSDGNAVGARVRPAWHPPDRPPEPWSTVVGIVDDTRMPEVRGDVAAMQVYSLVPPVLGDVPFVVRTTMSGDVSAPAIEHAISSVDPGLFVRPMLSGDSYLRDGLAPTRFAMALLTAFSALALVLAAVGLYGVIAYGVSQRTREIGIRLALGAEPRAIVVRVVGGSVRLVASGVVAGAAVAIATTRGLASMLYGVSPVDPLTFVAITSLIVAIALVASYIPARRALRIDPAETLRAE